MKLQSARDIGMRHFGLAIGCTVLLSGCFDTVNKLASPACAGTEQAASRLFLQQLSDSGALVRWRGEADVLCLGTRPDALDTRVVSIEEGGHREARLTGLRPDTVYYYSIGGAPTAPRAQHFRTAPSTGELPADGNTRVLLLGDSGTAGRELASGKAREETAAVAVKTGISRFLQSRDRKSVV